MDLYNTILSEITSFESSHTPLSDIAHKYEFQIIDVPVDKSTNTMWTCFFAVKNVDDYTITITIETKEIYRSFGNDDEPYRNTIALSKNGVQISSESYIYYE